MKSNSKSKFKYLFHRVSLVSDPEVSRTNLPKIGQSVNKSADLETPSHLLAAETETTSKKDILGFLPILEKNLDFHSTQAGPSKPRFDNENSIDILENDLMLSSSDSDPYAGDDDRDPEFTIPIRQRIILEDSESGENDDSSIKNTRKRVKKTETWKRNKIKKLRNSGKAYTNWKGKDIQERKLKPPCVNCRMKCTEKIIEVERELLFQTFWNLGDINRQRDFIVRNTECKTKARCRPKREMEQKDERKNFSYFYYFEVGDAKHKVCKPFFQNTLSISSQMIRTAYNKLNAANVVTSDQRGKACRNSQLDESVKNSIRSHIEMFQPIESHYCRKNSSRVYLPPNLNISKMYRMYEDYCQENDIRKKATESMYRHVFSTEYNISFFAPKKDLCDICHKYDNSNSQEKQVLEEDYQHHIKNKELARKIKNEDKKRAEGDKNYVCATFDLQQVLQVPKTEVGVAYYKLKLSTFNFTIFDLASKQGYCYMWHECIAKRGSSEIASSLLLFLKQNIEKGTKEFSFYSDSCPGQNKNKYLFAFYNYVVQKYNIKIKHTFLEKGHTQNEGDSIHSVIERASRNIPIYTPDQWYTLVRTCKKINPYMVIELCQENIFDMKDLSRKTSINWKKNDENKNIQWNKFKIIEVQPEFPNVISVRCTFEEGVDAEKISILKKGRKTMNFKLEEIHLKKLYNGPIALTKKKYEHLQYLCDKNVILTQYHNFFRNLKFTDKKEQSDSEDD